jgi:cytochrome b561
VIDKQVIANLRPIHGAYGLLVMLLFWYQAFLGFSIRKARREGGTNPGAIKRHRRNGPVIAMLAVAGYMGGAVLGYLDNGRLLKYPLHFLNGTAIIITVITTVIISRRMKARDTVLRNFHAALGLLLLCLYALQAFLGIGILF